MSSNSRNSIHNGHSCGSSSEFGFKTDIFDVKINRFVHLGTSKILCGNLKVDKCLALLSCHQLRTRKLVQLSTQPSVVCSSSSVCFSTQLVLAQIQLMQNGSKSKSISTHYVISNSVLRGPTNKGLVSNRSIGDILLMRVHSI